MTGLPAAQRGDIGGIERQGRDRPAFGNAKSQCSRAIAPADHRAAIGQKCRRARDGFQNGAIPDHLLGSLVPVQKHGGAGDMGGDVGIIKQNGAVDRPHAQGRGAAFPDRQQLFQPYGVDRNIVKPINDFGFLIAFNQLCRRGSGVRVRHARRLPQRSSASK
jgi:hypothetical protein